MDGRKAARNGKRKAMSSNYEGLKEECAKSIALAVSASPVHGWIDRA